MAASEAFGTEHRVDEIRERRDTENQRQHGHDVTYMRSHNAMKPTIAANVTTPRITIASESIIDSCLPPVRLR
jgi:hypothetical protein